MDEGEQEEEQEQELVDSVMDTFWDSDETNESVQFITDMDSAHPPAPPSSKCTVTPATAVVAASSITAGASPTYPPVPSGKKSSSKPPFLLDGAVNSMESRSGQTSAKPDEVQAKKGLRDDSAEFRGEYNHAKDMYDIFNQVSILKIVVLGSC